MSEADLLTIAMECCEELDCDAAIINTGMDPGVDVELRRQVHARDEKAERVVAILITEGGLADVAYRCARILQANYKQVTVCIPGWCKSAGTLLALGSGPIKLVAELGNG